MSLWKSGKIAALLKEGQALQSRLKNENFVNNENLATRFRIMVINGNIKGALRLFRIRCSSWNLIN